MAFQMDVEVSGDATSLRVDFLTKRMRLNAEELDTIITTLAQCRALMTPAHDGTSPPEHASGEASNMHWHVGPHPLPAQLRLALRHPGYGWVTAPLTLASAEKLEKQLHHTRLARQSVTTQTATISRLPTL
jgi:hypothetical protein